MPGEGLKSDQLRSFPDSAFFCDECALKCVMCEREIPSLNAAANAVALPSSSSSEVGSEMMCSHSYRCFVAIRVAAEAKISIRTTQNRQANVPK